MNALKMMLMNRKDVPPLLAERWPGLSGKEKEQWLAFAWQNSDLYGEYDYSWWLPFFKEVGYITNNRTEKPREAVTLYRGALPEFKNGMSWTPKLWIAKFYRFQNNENGKLKRRVYQVTVQPDLILGIVAPPFALEYILDYSRLDPDEIIQMDL